MSRQKAQVELGEKFGKWEVINESIIRKYGGKAYISCKCECGLEKEVSYNSLKRKESEGCRSCQNKSHGLYNHRLYSIWDNMIQRCTNKNDERYIGYGFRGIQICPEWRNNFTSFYNWAINNGYEDYLYIDRRDNDGNYEPSNCRWITNQQNCWNSGGNRGTNITSKYKGVHYEKYTEKWRSCISKDDIKLKLKRVETEEQAAIEYNKKAKDLFQQYAFLNIIDPFISFCIITTKETSCYISLIINSINNLEINKDEFEIIIVGGDEVSGDNIIHIPFDETIKPLHITKKKNLANSAARFPNVIHSHDYFAYHKDFYKNFVKFNKENPSWEIMMASIKNLNGSRYRDWCAWCDPRNGPSWKQREPIWCPSEGLDVAGSPFLAPYNYDKTHYMYISGGWLMARKYVMEKEPWDDRLWHGVAEDCEWSKRTLQDSPNKYNYLMNESSIIQMLKYKDPIFQYKDIV